MRRLLLAFLLLVACLAGGGALVWYFAYAADDRPPPASTVPGLGQATPVHWQPNGIARIEAAARPDALAALGYVHGTQRLWSIALWRQTALGRLGEWFGRGVLPLDRHARQLGLGALAETAYAALPDSTQRLLTAYAAGVNAALADDAARRHDELVLLGLSPAEWEPWHALAVERLVAWLATAPPPDTVVAAASPAAQRFFAADTQFRQWLHVHGLQRSVAWGLRGVQRDPALFQRHTYGTSTLPLVHEAIIEAPGGGAAAAVQRVGATLPGTPFFIGGRAGRRAWASLLHSPMDLTFAPVDSSALATAHDRIRFPDGGETLLTTPRAPGRLPLGPPAGGRIQPGTLSDTLSVADSLAAVDSMRTRRRSVWQVQWPGLQPVSDAAAWLALPQRPSAFRLMSGRGLHLQADGNWSVFGDPPVVTRLGDAILVGQAPWAAEQARALAPLLEAERLLTLEALGTRDSSAWAAQGAASVLPTLLHAPPADSLLGEAITYLRNWNYTYDRASIGASIFESWLHAHRTATDSLPFRPPRPPLTPPDDSLAYVQWTDSLRADSLRRSRALQATLLDAARSLATRFGSDLRQWRWERVAPTSRHFPVWSADSLVDRDLEGLSDTRYAAIERPGRGHPSALSGGASLLDDGPRSGAAWAGWTTAAPGAPFMVRRPRAYADVPLDRYALPDRRPPAMALRSDTTARATTVLRPAPR